MKDFATAFDRLLGAEGGYVDDPLDPGGETNWGITWPVLKQAMGENLVPGETTIRGLTREQARAIYEAFFWKRAGLDKIDFEVAFQVFDAAVNHGIETAVRMLQRAVGVADDGHVGPVTQQAIVDRSPWKVSVLFVAERIEFWTRLKGWDHDGKGWARRAAADLRYAVTDA